MAVIEAIATTYLEADAATVLFDDIPSTYEHLQLRMSVRDTALGTAASIYMELGGTGDSPVDTGANYSRHYMKGEGSSVAASSGTGNNNVWLGKSAASGSPAAEYSSMIIDVLDYANSNKNTTIMALNNGLPESISFRSGLWDDTSVLNAIRMDADSNFVRGSEFTLYGLKSS